MNGEMVRISKEAFMPHFAVIHHHFFLERLRLIANEIEMYT